MREREDSSFLSMICDHRSVGPSSTALTPFRRICVSNNSRVNFCKVSCSEQLSLGCSSDIGFLEVLE